MTITIQTLAAEMSHAFETATRCTTGETFIKLEDDAPAWMTTICRKAHDDAAILPDDWRYRFIEEAVDALAECRDDDEGRDRLEPDVYTGQLTGWPHSRNSRVFYLGEVIEEYGPIKDGFKLLAVAQLIERQEVLEQVVHALHEELESRQADPDGEGE